MSNWNKPWCSHCNPPTFDEWAHPHDPYGRRSVPVCDPCAEKAWNEWKREQDDATPGDSQRGRDE